jgi:GNAT superfamily N-acetyltransferase
MKNVQSVYQRNYGFEDAPSVGSVKPSNRNESIFLWQKNHFEISTDKNRLDVNFIHQFLTQSHWATGIDRDTVESSLDNSVCFGLYRKNRQIGFARIITDYATFSWFCDVFITPEYRGVGLGTWLIQCCLEYPIMKKMRRIMLVTTFAPWLYSKAGFEPLNRQDYIWHIYRAPTPTEASAKALH